MLQLFLIRQIAKHLPKVDFSEFDSGAVDNWKTNYTQSESVADFPFAKKKPTNPNIHALSVVLIFSAIILLAHLLVLWLSA